MPYTTSTPSSISTSKAKHREKHVDGLTRDDDDDNLALAKCMARKSQLNQQMSSDLVALHQQHDSPTTRDSPNANNKYTYTQYQQLQLQLQYQQQLMLQYQQQQQKQQQQNLVVYHGSSLGQYPHYYHHHQQGNKPQPIMAKPKSSLLSPDQDPKATISPTTFAHRVSYSTVSNSSFPFTNALKIDSRQQRHSLLSSYSDGITKNRRSQGGSQQQQQREINRPMTPMAKQIMARRSSCHSHTSSSSSSVATASNVINISNEPAQVAVSKNHTKPSLSKRIRGMLMGKDTDKQIYAASSSSCLQRSSSVKSSTSTNTARDGDSSSTSLWTNLLRKSSRTGSANYNIEKQTMHGKRSNGQSDVVPDSPVSSISGSSYHRSFLHQENYFGDDLPSPASSTSPELPLNYSTGRHNSDNYLDSSQNSELGSQLDYFALITPSSQQRYQSKSSPCSVLQHGSPRLRPSSNNQQISNSLLVTDSDGLPENFLESTPPNTSIKLPVISIPPISSESSSVSTSTSSLTLDHQECDNIKPALKSFSTKLNTKTQFATTIQVHDTFGSQDYDRRCDTQLTCQRLTSVLALQIKKELNEYKLNEMQVHIQSRQNTQFFL